MIVKFFAFIRDYTHARELAIDGPGTVRELLLELCRLYGRNFEEKVFKGGELSSEVIILVNGRHIAHCDGIDTMLSCGDEVSIFPVVAGG